MNNQQYPARSKKERFTPKAGLVSRDLSDGLGKLAPNATDLEESVLGAMMLERSALMSVVDIIQPEDFYLQQHQEIFQAICDLYRGDSPVDMRTVVTQLRRNGKLELIGGAYYIAELTSKVSSAANIEYHARVVNEFSIRRKLIQIGTSLQQEAYDETNDVFELISRHDQRLGDDLNNYFKGKAINSNALMKDTITGILARKSKHGVTGVPSGFTSFDRVTAGFQNTELTIVAARPGMGKTGFIVTCMVNAAKIFKIPVAMFSLEMSAVSLGDRIISAECEIPIEALRKNNLSDVEYDRMMRKSNEIQSAPFFIDDTSALHIFELRARAKRLKNEHDIQLIIVDYLQLMKGDQRGNREQEISSISSGLKQLAKELKVPVIALSQLSRSVETRGGDKRPQLSDLRESGSIEQDADMVCFLYRPEYYGIKHDSEGLPTDGVMEVIIAKHRNGSLDNVPLKFIGKYTKVTEWAEVPKAFEPQQEQRLPYKEQNEEEDLPF